MSDYLATALVRVRPDTKGFREDLRKQLKERTSNIGTVPIPIKPRIVAFREELQREVRRKPLLVPVKPDMKGFREELIKRVRSSAKGVTIGIPVNVAGAAPRPVQQPGVDPLGNITSVTRKAAAVRTATAAVKDAEQATNAAQKADVRLALAENELARGAIRKGASIETGAQALALDSKLAAQDARAQELLRAATAAGNKELAERAAVLSQVIALQRASLAGDAANIDDFNRGLRRTGTDAAEAARRMSQLSRGFGSTGLAALGARGATLAAGSEFLVGAAAATAFFGSVKLAANQERDLNVFRVTAEATRLEMDRAGVAARQLGSDITLPGVSARDATETFTLLSRAGIDVQNSLAGARGTLQLATAAEIDNAEATELVASALNAFSLSGEQATKVADLLAAAANESQGSILDVGIALQQSSAIARQAGISLEDTVAFLTQLQRAGIQGSDAGTSLRTALARLIAPTNKAKAIIESLGVTIRDAQGNIRPEVFAELGAAAASLGRAGQEEALARIFGQDAIRAVSIFTRQGTEGLEEVQGAIDDTGAAAELAEARMVGLGGQFEALKNQGETFGATIGSVAKGPISSLLGGLTRTLGAANRLTDVLRDDSAATAAGNYARLSEEVDKAEDRFQSLIDMGVPEENAAIQSGIADLDREFAKLADNASVSTSRLEGYDGAAKKAGPSTRDLRDAVGTLGLKLRDTANAALIANQSLRVLRGELAAVEESALDITIAGGTPQQEIANLREQEENLRLQLGVVGISDEERRSIKEDLAQVIEQRRSLQEEILNDREQAERDRKQAAEERARNIQRARDEADRAFFNALDLRESRLTTALIRAQTTERLQDDLRAQQALRDFYRRSIAEIRKTVKDAQARRDAIADAQQQIAQAEDEIRQTQREIAEARREERQEARERVREGLRLNVEIAEATGNRAAEIRAREAEIKRIEAEIRQQRKGSLARKRLILELRQAQRDLRELKAEAAKTNGAAQSFFQFLQAQQGFAANLFGNLIPIGLTSGLVGNAPPPSTAGSGTTPGGGSGGPAPVRARVQNDIDDVTAQAAAADVAGPTRGQATTQTELLRESVRLLRFIATGRTHPEAAGQRNRQSATMDYGI